MFGFILILSWLSLDLTLSMLIHDHIYLLHNFTIHNLLICPVYAKYQIKRATCSLLLPVSWCLGFSWLSLDLTNVNSRPHTILPNFTIHKFSILPTCRSKGLLHKLKTIYWSSREIQLKPQIPDTQATAIVQVVNFVEGFQSLIPVLSMCC